MVGFITEKYRNIPFQQELYIKTNKFVELQGMYIVKNSTDLLGPKVTGKTNKQENWTHLVLIQINQLFFNGESSGNPRKCGLVGFITDKYRNIPFQQALYIKTNNFAELQGMYIVKNGTDLLST